VTAEDVDAAMRFGFGFRYVAAGPIPQKELAGLDTHFAGGKVTYPSLNNGTEPSPTLRRLIETGKFGAKSGEGFRRGRHTSLDRHGSATRKCSALHQEDFAFDRSRARAICTRCFIPPESSSGNFVSCSRRPHPWATRRLIEGLCRVP
jgi:3-hydroxyacyl-CoA dehydrogenase